jgi:hypothetical protein
MPVEALIEERFSAIKVALAELQRRLPPQPSNPNWLEQVIGSFKDEPAFEEVIAYGREFREADRPSPDDGS